MNPLPKEPKDLDPNDPWRHVQHEVVLCNFGGPTCSEEVGPFLRNLFEDPFIIRTRLPLWLRQRLAAFIARRRRPKSTAEYEQIGYSPINRYTDFQARTLERLLRLKRPDTNVRVVNRYTAPSAEEVVKAIPKEGVRLFLITLYPHLCHSTTVSSFRNFDLAYTARHGSLPRQSVRVYAYWNHPQYLTFDFARIQQALTKLLEQHPEGPITVLFSAHGIPNRYHEKGDPYVNDTGAHAAALTQRGKNWLETWQNGRHAQRCSWELSFQSRVGPVDWVKPYTDETIASLGRTRGGHLLLVPISFTADHIETLYEMDITYQQLALESGFSSYQRAIPANDDPAFAEILAAVLTQHGF